VGESARYFGHQRTENLVGESARYFGHQRTENH
jgi:hypothetical protein